MKIRHLFFIVFAISTLTGYSQLITVTPALPTDLDGVEVVFDATQGSGGLAGYTGDVYAHTGVITNLSTSTSDWKYVKADWGVNIPACKLTNLGNNKWKLAISPSIRDYYGVPANEQIEKLAFVFRSGVQVGGTWLEGKTSTNGDIFYDIYPSGLSVKITNPDQDFMFAQIGVSFAVSVSSLLADSTILYANGQQIAANTGTSLSTNITPTQYGRVLVKAIAKTTTNMVADSFYYYVRPPVVTAELPAGIIDGINYISADSLVLCLYAPLKEFAFVLGDFNNWLPGDLNYMFRTPDGKRYWCPVGNLVPGKEYVYQYFVDGSIRVGDPYAKKVSDPWNDHYIDDVTYPGLIDYPAGKTSGVATVLQTNQPEYTWQTTNFTMPPVTDLVIYELLIRDFSSPHSFQSIIDTLPYLKRMGINAIEFMPVSEFEGNLSWGYNPCYYFAVDKYYGTEAKLKEMIDVCHANGIAVILDMVLNHSFGTSPYVQLYWDAANSRPAANSPYYNTVAKHDFNVGFDFNHESQDTKDYMKRILEYWITDFKVDGYRFDLSKGFTQNNTLGNTGAWGNYDGSRISILTNYHNIIKAKNANAVLILEHFANNDEEKELSNRGMLLWGNINYNYNEAAMGYTSNSDISWASYASRGWSNPTLVSYMESHDEERQMFKCISSGNSTAGYSIKDTTIALQRAALTATFFLTIPGPKMIWQFGEMGYDYSINYPSGTSASRLDNKPPRWDYMSQERRRDLYNTYAALIHLRTENPVFRTQNFTLEVGGALKKIKLQDASMSAVILGNFNITSTNIIPNFHNTGRWYDYLNNDSIEVSDVTAPITLKAGEAKVYLSKKVANPYGFGENVASGFDVQIAPNPVTDACKILLTCKGNQLYEVSFYNLSGIQVSKPMKGKLNQEKLLTWYPETPGLYLIRVQVGNQVTTKKVVVY
ncbi:MAG: T9SS type A sorting domain-containing protein [Bacteroidales bacterium]|nr:T9SS type A sorting domain-containing protein [Bacteroidales bacterium]